jgi:hypothetical protein
MKELAGRGDDAGPTLEYGGSSAAASTAEAQKTQRGRAATHAERRLAVGFAPSYVQSRLQAGAAPTGENLRGARGF